MTIKPGEVLNPLGVKSFGNSRRGNEQGTITVYPGMLGEGTHVLKRAYIVVFGLKNRERTAKLHKFQLGYYEQHVTAEQVIPHAMLWLSTNLRQITDPVKEPAKLHVYKVLIEIKGMIKEETMLHAGHESLTLNIDLRGGTQ